MRFQLPQVCAVLGALALILVIVNAFLVLNNQRAESDVQRRQMFINQTLQVNQAYNAMLQQLASVALTTDDLAIRNLLDEHGYKLPVDADLDVAPAGGSP